MYRTGFHHVFVAFACLFCMFWISQPASGQYRPQWGNRYYPPNYRPRPNTNYSPRAGYANQPAVPQPDANGIVTIRKSFAQTPINTRTPGVAKTPKDFQRMDFRNPSLELLKQLGDILPPAGGETNRPFPRLVGEFEPQKAIMLSLADLMEQHHDVFRQIVRATAGQVSLIVLVNDLKQLKTGVRLAKESTNDCNHVSFAVLPLNTIWLRDFGPIFAELESGYESLDFLYDGTRPKDERLPTSWSTATGQRPRDVSWTLQGGNLISNGNGLAITSTRLFEDNMIRFPRPTPGMNVEYERRKIVVENFKKECNLDQLVFLHPLAPEATKHVDMFATFLARDHIVVASVDPRRDRYNAHVLDVNARLLKSLKVDGKPMRVDRIEIPIRQDRYWSPYTNIIRANDLLLMPVYQGDPQQLAQRAVQTYRRLLPNVTVKTIDLTSMKKLEGALHCMSINVPQIAKLPIKTIAMDQAQSLTGVQFANAQTPPKNKATMNPPRAKSPEERKPPKTAATRSQAKRSTNSTAMAQQRKAANTYRKTFRDKSGRYEVEAAAIGVTTNSIVLLRSSDKRTIKVSIANLSETDRIWINQNATKIQANGKLVQDFFLKFGF